MRMSRQGLSATGPLLQMYKYVLDSVRTSKSERDLDILWSRLAPSGNIYRYIALRTEQRRNTYNLKAQLQELAEKHAEVLGGAEEPLEKRTAQLVKLLSHTVAKDASNVEEGQEAKGFPPVEEFIAVDGSCCNDGEGRWQKWRKNHLMASLVFTIQVIGPFLILINNWYKPENQLRDPKQFLHNISLHEAVCLGQSLSGALTTIMGTMLLVIVNTMIFHYAQGEQENAQKLGPIPMDNFWCTCGTIANASCCLVISLVIPIQFWAEDGPTGLIMNAMALLFIFSFDDLTSDAFSYLDEDDTAFQREVSWFFALLSHCPVQLGDLINPDAQSADELWRIAHDSSGKLLLATSETPCDTRLCLAAPDETTPLDDWETLPEISYRVSADKPVRSLPGWRERLCNSVWAIIVAVLQVIWWVVPLVWFIVNKPCKE